MELIHKNPEQKAFSLSTIRSEKRLSDVLQSSQKELLHQIADTLTVIQGGHFKRRRQIA